MEPFDSVINTSMMKGSSESDDLMTRPLFDIAILATIETDGVAAS